MIIDDLIAIAEKERAARKKIVLRCCMAAGCMSSDSEAVKAAARQGRRRTPAWPTEVEVRGVGCMKLCCEGPLVAVDPQDALYEKVTPENAPSIVAALERRQDRRPAQATPNHAVFREAILHRAGQQRRD